MKKVVTISNRGGTRPGAGRPATGKKKLKISVSVDRENWNSALSKWGDKGSRLVEKLISEYNQQSSR